MPQPKIDQCIDIIGLGGHIAAQADRLTGRSTAVDGFSDQLKHGTVGAPVKMGNFRLAPIAGGNILNQVIAADGEKISIEIIDTQGHGRYFNHDTQGWSLQLRVTATQLLQNFRQQPSGVFKLARDRHHRQHNPEITESRRAQESP